MPPRMLVQSEGRFRERKKLTTLGHLRVDEETHHLLLEMSPTTIGRLLAGERYMYRLHGICSTRSTPLGGRIPIQTCLDPPPEDFCPIRGVLPLDIPGVLAVDLVGHNRGQAGGDFGWTLTGTDQSTGWTEAGAVHTKAGVYVVAALESCLRWSPGRGSSLYSNNGSAFIGDELKRSTPPSEP
jgi:hypothetical protein